MEKAYLVRAYDQPEMMARMIRRLSCREAHFFIHIDRRASVAPFQEALRQVPGVNAHWLEKRIRVRWMGFSQVEAALALMRQASAFADFPYYSLLSGTDYPLKRNEEILAFLEDRKTEYLSYWRIEDRPAWKHKIEYYYPTDLVPIQNFEARFLPRLFWKTYFRWRHRLPKRKPQPGIVPYGGTSWWTLTHACVRFVLNYVDLHPGFCDFYRHTHSPDETFFQTIILNSPFAERAAHIDRYRTWMRQRSPEDRATERNWLPEQKFDLRYVDWDATREKPAILDERDFERLRQSPCLFARKFLLPRSERLLDLIDDRLLKCAT